MQTKIKTNNNPAKVYKVGREFKKNLPLFIMTIPAVVLTFIFSYLPMFGIIIAFKRVNMRQGIFGSPWCGTQNFKFLFSTNDLWIITRNTLGYNIFFMFAGLIIAVALAIILNSLKNKRGSKVYQTLLIMPHFLSYVIVAYLVLAFLNMENGYLNAHIMPLFGLDTVNNPINWYSDPKPWPIILTIVRFWKEGGYSCIVYLAAIAGIDAQLYEAAEIDGAGVWHQIRYITLPSLKTLIIIQMILKVGAIFNGDFGLFFQVTMNQGALYSTTNIINTYVYNMLTGSGTMSLGLSSAASFIQSVLGFILVIITNLIVRRIEPDSALF